jgi:hypothetical protein
MFDRSHDYLYRAAFFVFDHGEDCAFLDVPGDDQPDLDIYADAPCGGFARRATALA